MWPTPSFKEALSALQALTEDPAAFDFTQTVSLAISKTFRQGGKLILCGNGGSACDAMHIAEEFTGRYRNDRAALPALSLTDPGYLTCVGNDYGFDEVFARGIDAFAQPHDIVWVLSSSGNSPNIIKALETCVQKQIPSIALLGKTGGKSKTLSTHTLIVPGENTDRIQELHMIVGHIIIEGVERILFPENY
jgi:D-sedoheptulose 7-phosphate isomerase